jgi:hypothetical protein
MKFRYTGFGYRSVHFRVVSRMRLTLDTFSRALGRRRQDLRPAARPSGLPLLPQQLERALEEVVAAIDACIERVTTARLHDTAALLSIARLDLVAHLNGITELELQDVTAAAQDALAGAADSR